MGHAGDQRHGLEVLDRVVVGRFLVQAGRDPQRRGGHQQRVAVGGRLGHERGRDHGAGARLVDHHDGLAEVALQLGRDLAGHYVRDAAGRERNHDVDRLGRVALRVGGGARANQGCGQEVR
ncbi:hypothetical protein D3C72_1944900 [compost metagenome]